MSSYNVLTWPDSLLPDKWSWGQQRLDTKFPAPFNTVPQVLRRGANWLCDLEWNEMGPSESQPLGALLSQLADKSNVILVRDYGYQMQGAGLGPNLYKYSQQFDNSAWKKVSASVTANAAVAPDGTTTADLYIPNTTLTYHVLNQTADLAANTQYTLSVYAKAGGYSQFIISLRGFTSSGAFTGLANANVDLSAGTVTGAGATITAEGSGWYRISITGTNGAAGSVASYLLETSNMAGDGSSGYYLWGAQLEKGDTAGSYTATTAGAPAFQSLGSDKNHIVTNDWPASTRVLEMGDMMQLANMRLLQATAAVDSDATGAATIPITPELRALPTAGSLITLTNPGCYMQLADNKFMRAVERPSQSALRISMQEVKIT